MPVARAYLEHHVVLAELLHELLAVAHVPAQICEDGWGKRSARGSRVDRRDGSRLLSPGVPFCRAWKSFASIASLSWMVFRADIVARVPLHACDAREVSGDRAGLPRKSVGASQRGGDSNFPFEQQAQVPPSSHNSHTPRATFASGRARVGGMFYSVDLLSPKGALGQIWVRRARTMRLAPAPRARFPLSSFVPVLDPPSTERA